MSAKALNVSSLMPNVRNLGASAMRTPPSAIAPMPSSSCPGADLAHDQHIQRRIEPDGDLVRHGSSAARQRQNDRGHQAQVGHEPRQGTTRIDSIGELVEMDHDVHLAMIVRPALLQLRERVPRSARSKRGGDRGPPGELSRA
jgi:hypothetical protein